MTRLRVRLDNPLKQGLKLPNSARRRIFDTVRLDNPLKQGLKHPRRNDQRDKPVSAWTIH